MQTRKTLVAMTLRPTCNPSDAGLPPNVPHRRDYHNRQQGTAELKAMGARYEMIWRRVQESNLPNPKVSPR
jgi:hypothetical protein